VYTTEQADRSLKLCISLTHHLYLPLFWFQIGLQKGSNSFQEARSGVMKAVCKYCGDKLTTSNKSGKTIPALASF
jgi:hypothetical protein